LFILILSNITGRLARDLFQGFLHLLQNIAHLIVKLQKPGALLRNIGMTGRSYLLKQFAHFHSAVLGVPDKKRSLLA